MHLSHHAWSRKFNTIIGRLSAKDLWRIKCIFEIASPLLIAAGNKSRFTPCPYLHSRTIYGRAATKYELTHIESTHTNND
jgi:hypothetical protein